MEIFFPESQLSASFVLFPADLNTFSAKLNNQSNVWWKKIQIFTCVITILMKFDIHFLELPWEIFFGVTTDELLHLSPLKNVKK